MFLKNILCDEMDNMHKALLCLKYHGYFEENFYLRLYSKQKDHESKMKGLRCKLEWRTTNEYSTEPKWMLTVYNSINVW